MRLPSGHRSAVRLPRLLAVTALLLAAGVTASCGMTVIDRRPPTKGPTGEPTVSQTAPADLTMPRSYGTVTQGLGCAELVELTDSVWAVDLYGRTLSSGVVAGAVPSSFDAASVTWCDIADDDLVVPSSGGPGEPVAPEGSAGPEDLEAMVVRTSEDRIHVDRVVAASREFPTRVGSALDPDCVSADEKMIDLWVFVTDVAGNSAVVGWPTHHGSCTWDWITDPADVLAEVFGAERE